MMNFDNYEKVWIWEEYRCGRRKSLPEHFFELRPFMHPSGQSFAYLYFLINENQVDKNWVQNNLMYFHLEEWVYLKRQFNSLQGIFEIFAKFDTKVLKSITEKKGTILTKDFMLAKITYPTVFSIVEYRVYDRYTLDNFLNNSSFVLKNFSSAGKCLYREGELCWDYNLKFIYGHVNRTSFLILFALIVIIIIIARLLFTKIKQQRIEDERRRLALHVLTHEFRTPVSSLILIMDRLLKKSSKFDEDTQEALMRASREVFRMQRMTEKSRSYLKFAHINKFMDFKIEIIPSVNDYFSELLDPYIEEGRNIELVGLEIDSSIVADSYWLSICLKNLIENAIFHGKEPVKISLFEFDQYFQFDICDSGQEIFDTENIFNEFVKGKKSSGTGLGLNIVKKVLVHLKGKIEVECNPTIFRVKISKGDKV